MLTNGEYTCNVCSHVNLSIDRLKKLFYYNVVLTSDTKALSFISTLRTEELVRAAVKALHLESSVSVESCTRILQLCEGLEELSLHVLVFPRHAITSSFDSPAKPLLPHLYKFYKLRSLTINLSTIFVGDEAVYLPRVPLFERITHLHIINAWVLWCRSTGLESLANLTHLSLHISTLHVHVHHLRTLLRSDRLQVLVLWRREPETYNHVQCCLSSIHIRDARIVIMNNALFREYTHEEHAFWDYVGAMVSWRKASMGKISRTHWLVTYKNSCS